MGVRLVFKAAAMLIIVGYCSLLAYQGVVSFKVEATRPVPVTVLDSEITESTKPSDYTNITLDDIFISVKTSKYFINTRLPVILKTWYQLAKNQTWFFTDIDNKKLKMKTRSGIAFQYITLLEKDGHMVNTNCSASHQRRSLCCKTSVEFDYYLESGKKWFCHFDDDNYVNIPRLVEVLNTFNYLDDWYLGKNSYRRRVVKVSRDNSSGKPRPYVKARFWFATGGAGYCISKALASKMKPMASGGNFTNLCEDVRYADDVTLGYLIEHLLHKVLTVVPEFHSHIEQLGTINPSTFKDQVSFSYNIADRNFLKVPGFSEAEDEQQDPTRLYYIILI